MSYKDMSATAGIDSAISTWSLNNATASPNSVVAPDGTLTADTFTAPASGEGVVFRDYSGLRNGQTYTYSMWVKLGSATNLGIALNNGFTDGTISGDKVFTSADGLNSSTWTKVYQTFTADATGSGRIHLGRWSPDGTAAQTGGTVYVWGASLTQGRDNDFSVLENYNGVTPVASNNVIAPDGTLTGDTMTMTPASETGLLYGYRGLVANVHYTYSVWAKLGTATTLGVAVNNGNSTTSLPGDKVFTSADGLNSTTWTQVSIEFTADSFGAANIHLGRFTNQGTGAQTDGTVYLWGSELQPTNSIKAAFESSLSPTTPTFSITATDVLGNVSAASTSTLTVSNTTPLLLDLNGDGIHTVGQSAGVLFDVGADGALKRTGWVDAQDGVLALDLNSDGTINNGSELFGTGTTLPNGSKAANGYAALAQYDANQDGVIDANDAVFAKLKVWVDADTDGTTDAGELKGLTDLGIASFNLNGLNATGGENGNSVILQSSWKDVNGVSHSLADWTFQTDDRQVLVASNGTGTLTGSNGGDVFRVAQGSTGTLTVAGFNASQNDALDLSALLKNANLTTTSSDATLSKFVQLTQSGNDAVFKVDTSGSGNFVAPAETIVFTNGSVYGLNDTLNHLVANGHVILS
ncbi:MAG: type I secretion C-terminal target domain-containing protein [Limnohabitans sp.]|nr:type I secretion C-terminal target domain-containing protein [Limnohabitans sp.]